MKAFLPAGALALGLLAAAPALAQHQGHDMGAMPPPAPAPAEEHRHHEGMAMPPSAEHSGHGMRAALGPYPATREASGTAWQPDVSPHHGVMGEAGGWSLMGHGVLNLVADTQQGPRGADKAFASGMVMGMAQRGLGSGVLQFKAMVSPDPLMGKRGYPLLLASGETADGVHPLIDRQHPHDFFMELSASYSLRLTDRASLFLYGGLPGEPAFGPPAFMHRLSTLDSPEAPITHHWLDSTHIVFGVATAGLVVGRAKLEASRFHGREPDQHRWDIETGPLDSTAVRVSFNPAPEWALQASWARIKSPEQLEPERNQTRWSASAIYTKRLGGAGERWWSTTFAWGRRSAEHGALDAAALEGALGLGAWTLFGRAEYAENDELAGSGAGGHHGRAYKVGKASLGAVRDFRMAEHVKLGAGALVSLNFVPHQLEALYAGDPKGAMAFVRVKVE